MSRKSKVPDPKQFRERWQRLDRAGKRRVRRAVNRGHACEQRDEAGLAVVVARQQQRAWLVTWPLVSVLIALPSIPQGWMSVVVTAFIGATIYAPIALFFRFRATRAEQRNLEFLERRSSGKKAR